MNPEDIVAFSRSTIDHLENDRRSFEQVIDSAQFEGKLGFALIATAMAAFDTYSWILFQNYDKQIGNSDLFSKLLCDTRFFDKNKYGNDRVFYARIRCGVMHQLYPKDAAIVAEKTTTILYQHSGALCINAYALYCDVLDGIRKVHAYLVSLPATEKLNLSFKLHLRVKMDAEAAGKAYIDVATLPTWP